MNIVNVMVMNIVHRHIVCQYTDMDTKLNIITPHAYGQQRVKHSVCLSSAQRLPDLEI
jgi:hypothetical protein